MEATNLITGFPPDALLMTSAYDAVFDEDLPGFLFIKTQFWDRGHPGVEVYLRRRTIEGDWVWLISKAVSYVEEPIPGIIIQEIRISDEDEAIRINRITRITAILVQAVEAAYLTEMKLTPGEEESQAEKAASRTPEQLEHDAAAAAAAAVMAPQFVEDAEAYRSLINAMAGTFDSAASQDQSLESLMKIAESGGVTNGAGLESKLEQELKENVTGTSQKKNMADPGSMIESVRQGVRLDLGLTRLQHDEIKMIALVLAGKIPVDDVAISILHAMRTGQTIADVFKNYHLDISKSSTPRHSPEKSSIYPSPLNSAPVKLPPISVINLSYTYIGNSGAEMLAEVLHVERSVLRTIDISFCAIEEKGFLALARCLARRKRKEIPPLRGVILSGNYITTKSAAELGFSLSPAEQAKRRRPKRTRTLGRSTGYESDSAESDDDDDDDDDDFDSRNARRRRSTKSKKASPKTRLNADDTLTVLHVANTSMTADALSRLLEGLGAKSLVRELNLSSNNFGPEGASVLVRFLESKQKSRDSTPMALLDRLDMSNNSLGDNGTTQLTKLISRRSHVHLIDLRLSSNSIGAGGIETIMNKLLQHNLMSLSLDKNAIGDQGCQLVAASLQSMKALSRLNLSFNQIGSRGINSLMRSLVGCESITYLGLSGNILRISGAIALAFTLAQHPRLEELDLDNCCLGRAAQCHISAGIISNRWVPMKRLRGYAVGPPLVAIGALKPYAQNLSNEECFRIRKDEQMKTILQWMESNRIAKKHGASTLDPNLAAAVGEDNQSRMFLTPEYVSTINEIHGTPSQNAYFRLLGWLSRIPFDEDELTALQKYFYDPDGGEGDRGSDGYINLKLRGDLLAALDSEVADEIRDELPSLAPSLRGSIGIDLDKLHSASEWDSWEAFKTGLGDLPPQFKEGFEDDENDETEKDAEQSRTKDEKFEPDADEQDHAASILTDKDPVEPAEEVPGLAMSKPDISHSESNGSALGGREKSRSARVKARITMFPRFEQQLEELKATATEMIEQEEDEMQHEVILTQYAEASLTILRQLRYHCMNSGLDGWRQAGLKRKVLVIDDSTVTRKLVSRAFERANFIVDTAANGAEGVEKLKLSIYDIAFMDIDMPVMNGFEATKKLREWEDKMRPGARQPICALTAAYVDDFERSELMKFKEAGLDVMESKPCNIPRLFKVVDDVSPMFSDLSISVIQKSRSDSNSKFQEPEN